MRVCGFFVTWATFLVAFVQANYNVGVGIADCTGPIAEVNFLGYAALGQNGRGLHLRQFARAFIVDDGNTRVVYVSADIAMVGFGIKVEVIKRLSEIYGDVYKVENVIISATHTHGAPGGFMEHLLLDVTIFGHVRQSFEATVSGIVKAITRAHENLVPGRIFIDLVNVDASINRSPFSYDLNPLAERLLYDANVDRELVQLSFTTEAGALLGLINWYAVHPVSMNNTNVLVTSDNIGYASVLSETQFNNGALPGKGAVVVAFGSTNAGDSSPNIRGPICIDTGNPCDAATSRCGADSQNCIASGGGNDMYESTLWTAERLSTAAVEAVAYFSDDMNMVEEKANEYNFQLKDGGCHCDDFGNWSETHTKMLVSNPNIRREVTGDVRFIHQFVDMPTQEVEYTFQNGTTSQVRGCVGAMGYSFFGGTTDGPGLPLFYQGMTSSNFIFDFLRDILAPPTQADIECHAPKPILIASGRMVEPYEWQPRVLSTQLVLIGDVAIAAVPGELTTMAGRRLRNVIRDAVIENGGPSTIWPIVATLSNHYSNYITTYEEYQAQRFEGAATAFGPHTLAIHLAQFRKLAAAVVTGQTLDDGPAPTLFDEDELLSLVTPVILDTPDWNIKFGECIVQPPDIIIPGTTVTAVFVSGHPRNNLFHEDTFLTVERQLGSTWEVIATDASWETKLIWQRTYLASSEVTIEWLPSPDISPGTYRIRHFGHSRALFDGGHSAYEGSTNLFQVI